MSTTEHTSPPSATVPSRAATTTVTQPVPWFRPSVTPDDVVPRMVALGVPIGAADELAEAYPESRIVDALDAVEEIHKRGPVRNPLAWVDAAIRHHWDLTSILGPRRAREARIAARHTETAARDAAIDAYPEHRAISERWGTALAAALDDDQLGRAIEAVSMPVAGIGRSSIPVVRADLLAWTVEVHQRHPGVPLASALAADLDRGPDPVVMPGWPLPEPPPAPRESFADDPPSLSDRITHVLSNEVEVDRDISRTVEPAGHERVLRHGGELGR